MERVQQSVLRDSRVLPTERRQKGNKAMIDNRRTFDRILQLKTDIIYNTSTINYTIGDVEDNAIVGSSMHAWLDPGDPVHGSEPGSKVQGDLMKYFKDCGYKGMVRGHLLNAELGGLGIAANLYPITSKANSQHKLKVENYVKDYITNTSDFDENNRLEYRVDVEKKTPPEATFKCMLGHETSSVWDLLTCDITSMPEQGSTGSGDASEGVVSKNFINANLPDGWGHCGRGYLEDWGEHNNTLGKTQINGMDGKSALDSMGQSGMDYNFGECDFYEYMQFLYDVYCDKYEVDEPELERIEEELSGVKEGDFGGLYEFRNRYDLAG